MNVKWREYYEGFAFSLGIFPSYQKTLDKW